MPCNPGGPDGGYLPRREVVRFLDEPADLDLAVVVVVVDESFVDHVEVERTPSVAFEATVRPNAVVLRSPGKGLDLPGVRLGCLVANPGLARTVAAALPRWNLNSPAGAFVLLLREHADEHADSLVRPARDRYRTGAEPGRVPDLGCCRRRRTSCWSGCRRRCPGRRCATTCCCGAR